MSTPSVADQMRLAQQARDGDVTGFIKGCGLDPNSILIDAKPESLGGATHAQRKSLPVATGFLDYFPDAVVAVAELSRVGNEQHNPGSPLHWDRSKSGDEADALMRHLIQRGIVDSDGIRHSTKVAWRAMALLQKELEEARSVFVIPLGSSPPGHGTTLCATDVVAGETPEAGESIAERAARVAARVAGGGCAGVDVTTAESPFIPVLPTGRRVPVS